MGRYLDLARRASGATSEVVQKYEINEIRVSPNQPPPRPVPETTWQETARGIFNHSSRDGVPFDLTVAIVGSKKAKPVPPEEWHKWGWGKPVTKRIAYTPKPVSCAKCGSVLPSALALSVHLNENPRRHVCEVEPVKMPSSDTSPLLSVTRL